LSNDPIHQFVIQPIVPIHVGNLDFSFTNSSLFMVASVAIASGFLLLGSARKSLVPGRMQSMAEMSVDFMANTLRESAGSEGMRFLPFVFSLFMFIATANVLGIFPYFFTVTSHIIVTAAMALTVILVVVIYGLKRHGLHFFGLFKPSGIPAPLIPLVVAIEVISFLSRPISLSIRLFANMLAGHITLKVFAGFVIMLAPLGAVGYGLSILPIAMNVALYALELLVALIQAYVFAILTSLYLNDAIHPGH
jgi:F-type H+-transporting ATPase subunit a